MKPAHDPAPASGQVYEELLVTLVCAGDRKAGERLGARWQPRLARTARRMLGSEEEALGVVQEAWVSILRGLPTLRDPARFGPWAFGILRCRCADRIAAIQRHRLHDRAAEPDPIAPEGPSDALAIRQAFASLPPDQRLAAHLFFGEGLTLVEIAEVQDVPLGTAKTRLFHARRKLKAALT